MKKYNLIAAIALMGAVPAIAQETAPGPVLYGQLRIGMTTEEALAAMPGSTVQFKTMWRKRTEITPDCASFAEADFVRDKTVPKPLKIFRLQGGVTVEGSCAADAVETALRAKYGEPDENKPTEKETSQRIAPTYLFGVMVSPPGEKVFHNKELDLVWYRDGVRIHMWRQVSADNNLYKIEYAPGEKTKVDAAII
jgi:hypothetical protein